MNDLHYFFHVSYCVSIIQEVLGEFRFPIIVFKISHLFFESGLEWSSCLSGVCHLAVGAGQLVHSAFITLTLGLMFHGEAHADCVVHGKRNCYVRVFE